jgi:hypothetical protein
MKSAWFLVAVAAGVLIFLLFLSSGNKVPAVPQDDLHKNATTDASCIVCHSPGRQAPLKATHPPKEQCLICHKMKKKT